MQSTQRINRLLTCFLFFLLLFPLKTEALSVQEELKYGRQLYWEILQNVKLNNDPIFLIYIDNIKKRLEREASSPFPIKITLIESKRLDAFATLGGYIYLTTGLVAACEEEDELASVIAHEMAHIAKRHVSKRFEKEKKLNLAVLAGVFLAMLTPDPKAKEALLTSTMASYEAVALKYSREDEEEADLFGSLILRKAGYDLSAMKEFLNRLRKVEDKEVPQYLLTHPFLEERIKRLPSTDKGSVSSRVGFFPFLRLRLEIQSSTGLDQEKWSKDTPSDPLNLYRIALVRAKEGKIDEAVQFTRKIDLPFKDILLSELLIKAGKFKEAKELLEKDSSEPALYLHSICLESLEKKEEALLFLKNILSAAETCPEIYRRYGLLAGKLGREADGYKSLGRYELLLGRKDAAKRYIEKAISLYGINSEKGRELLTLLESIN